MPYPALAREMAWKVAPGLMADRARRYERDFRERQGVASVARKFVGEGPVRVQHGPFEGMSYPDKRIADIDAPVAKLLGTYEQEIHHAFTAALARGISTFIDVGCADGYYAVGMPYADHSVTTYAFDLSRDARDLCAEVARTNALESHVQIRRRFSAASLDTVDPAGALMLCDIEGAEQTLFDTRLVERLAQTTVIIEVHEHTDPGLSAKLQTEFATSHEVTVVSQVPREAVGGLAPIAFAEFRSPELHWLVCEPR